MFAKIDFSKAFDSVHWSFLTNVMQARGFPSRWINWINTLLSTSSSRIIVNGDQTPYFYHKRGLRQGDPLSPMLFIIAVDVLQCMVMAANETLSYPITTNLRESIIALQYADDTAIVANGSVQTLVVLRIVLRLFSKMSGLKINFQKSCVVSFNMDEEHRFVMRNVLGCLETELPVNYLGMPLTVRAPEKHMFIPLIEKFEKRLQGWKRKLLSRGGRLQLVRSVLSSLPIY